MPDELGHLLMECDVGEGAAARERAIEAALRRLPGRPTPRSRRRRIRLAIAGGLLAAAVGFGFTPAGSAVAEDIGRLIGIGDEPSDSFEASMIGATSNREEVFGLGTTPSGISFELAEQTTKSGKGDRHQELSCVYISYPDTGMSPSSASCLTNAALRGFERGGAIQVFPFLGPDGLASEEDYVVSFTALPEVARVEVSYPIDGEVRTAEATIAPFVAAPAQEAAAPSPRGDTPLAMGVAFLPSAMIRQLPPPTRESDGLADRLGLKVDPAAAHRLLSQIEVTAFDAEGNLLSRKNLDTPTAPFALSLDLARPDDDE